MTFKILADLIYMKVVDLFKNKIKWRFLLANTVRS